MLRHPALGLAGGVPAILWIRHILDYKDVEPNWIPASPSISFIFPESPNHGSRHSHVHPFRSGSQREVCLDRSKCTIEQSDPEQDHRRHRLPGVIDTITNRRRRRPSQPSRSPARTDSPATSPNHRPSTTRAIPNRRCPSAGGFSLWTSPP
jgi:hypothetical protein